MQTDSSLEETWDTSRKSLNAGPCAEFSLRDLAISIGYKPIFSVKEKRDYKAADFASMTYSELCAHPDFVEDPERVQRLIRLFRETAGYDLSLEGISSKVGRNDTAAQTMLNQLKVIDIPQDFPPKLMTISSTLKTLVEAEEVSTLKQFFEVSARFTRVLGKNQELADIERSFLSGSPARVRKYLPLNPDGQGTSIQSLMGGYMKFRAPHFAQLNLIAAALGMDYSLPEGSEVAPDNVVAAFLTDVIAYYADAAEYLPEGDEHLNSAMHDPKVFERATRLIDEAEEKFLLHYVVCKHHGEVFPDGYDANNGSSGSREENEGFFKRALSFFIKK